MRITPSLSLATLGAQRREGGTSSDLPVINFRLNASGTYREFFGQLKPEQRNFSADVNSRLDILPERPLGGAIFASYDRTIQPNSVSGDPDLSFNRDTVGVGAEIVTQPGGGTLDWHFGYQFMDTLFEDERRPAVRQLHQSSVHARSLEVPAADGADLRRKYRVRSLRQHHVGRRAPKPLARSRHS